VAVCLPSRSGPTHEVRHTPSGGDRLATPALTQDGNDSAEQAEQFSATWEGMPESLKSVVEAG